MEQASLFPKQIKLDDYGQFAEGNVIRLLETSNLLVGSGGRTSTASIVLAKTIHFLHQEGLFPLASLNILELGSGTGLLGIYLASLGANVWMLDIPPVKDLAERNIGINKKLLKGKLEFVSGNWQKKQSVQGEGKEREKGIGEVDMTVVCEGGGLDDLQHQLGWMGKKGMIVCFMTRAVAEDCLSVRELELYLIEKGIGYKKMEELHPDYDDERVQIYRLFPK